MTMGPLEAAGELIDTETARAKLPPWGGSCIWPRGGILHIFRPYPDQPG